MQPLPEQLAGCLVFPIQPGGKLPATRDGWHSASNDPAQIAEWQRINPDFNWGIATGPSGLVVFDIDPAGLDWWHKLLERDPAIKTAVDRAFTVRTPRGGLHVYFRGEAPSTASRIAEGIDTRGGIMREGKVVSGGYVVAPGCRTVEGPKTAAGLYEALPGGTVEALPAPLFGIIPERKKTDTLGLEKNPDADQPRNVSWAMDLLRGYVESGRVSVQGAGGNNLAFQVAASILDKAISPGTAFELLWDIWNPACKPPWDEWELEGIIRNAANYGEDTGAGVKGFQANADAFANFVGQEFEAPPPAPRDRDRIQPIHVYADGVGDPTWLVPGMLPAAGIGMLYGQSGSYKSFLALDMSLCLGFGIPGQWGAAPVKHDVLFLAGEGSIATAKKRWPAWMEWQKDVIEFRTDHRFFIKDRVPFFSDTEGWENVKADLAELNAKPSLIVIDTMARLSTGMDENSSKDATLLTNFMEQLARYYECTVLGVHHEGKDTSKGARGSSAFYANMDFVLATRKKEGGTELMVKKQKDADIGDERYFFQVEEHASSIVLARSKDTLPDPGKEKGSRFPWASVEEIVRVLTSLGGETSTAVLVKEIARANGIEDAVVKKQIYRDELKWLRPDNQTWKIPALEYDL